MVLYIFFLSGFFTDARSYTAKMIRVLGIKTCQMKLESSEGLILFDSNSNTSETTPVTVATKSS